MLGLFFSFLFLCLSLMQDDGGREYIRASEHAPTLRKGLVRRENITSTSNIILDGRGSIGPCCLLSIISPNFGCFFLFRSSLKLAALGYISRVTLWRWCPLTRGYCLRGFVCSETYPVGFFAPWCLLRCQFSPYICLARHGPVMFSADMIGNL